MYKLKHTEMLRWVMKCVGIVLLKFIVRVELELTFVCLH